MVKLQRNTYIKLVLIVVLCLLLVGALTGGCAAFHRAADDWSHGWEEEWNENGRGVHVDPSAHWEGAADGGFTLASEAASQVKNIELNWAAGSVDIQVLAEGAGEDITVTEESNSRRCPPLRWRRDGDTLEIDFGLDSGLAGCSAAGGKNLTVALPTSVAASLDTLEVNGASGTYSIGAITCKTLLVGLASGAVDVEGFTADCLEVGLASGRVTASGKTDTLNLDVASGLVEASFAEEAPRTVAADIASGTVTLTLPHDTGLHAVVDKLSGNFECDFPLEHDGTVYRCGDEQTDIRVDMTSGTMRIKSL